MSRVSDVLGKGAGGFYPDAVKVSINDCMAEGDVEFIDCLVIDNYPTDYGLQNLAIIVYEDKSMIRHSFATSALVLVDKFKLLKATGKFPITGQIVKEKGRYYNVV